MKDALQSATRLSVFASKHSKQLRRLRHRQERTTRSRLRIRTCIQCVLSPLLPACHSFGGLCTASTAQMTVDRRQWRSSWQRGVPHLRLLLRDVGLLLCLLHGSHLGGTLPGTCRLSDDCNMADWTAAASSRARSDRDACHAATQAERIWHDRSLLLCRLGLLSDSACTPCSMTKDSRHHSPPSTDGNRYLALDRSIKVLGTAFFRNSNHSPACPVPSASLSGCKASFPAMGRRTAGCALAQRITVFCFLGAVFDLGMRLY